jgi:chromosome segregation ATPase
MTRTGTARKKETQRRTESATSALRQELAAKCEEIDRLQRDSKEREDRMAAEIAVLRMELEKARCASGSLREQLEYARVKIAQLERALPPQVRDPEAAGG